LLRLVLDRSTAAQAGPAVASMAIYILMAVVLIFRPTGLFTGERSWTRTA
jgi:branched-chain amino acid transport system permease protein